MKAIYFTPFPREVVNPVPDDTVIARPPIHGGRVNAKRRVEIYPSNPPAEVGIHDSLVYCGNFIYSNQSLEQVLFDGGYMTLDSLNIPHYHFYQHDHLGSVRAVVDENGVTEERNNYYPFGATYGQDATPNVRRYKYNGKELDRMHGLNLLDYGARWYNPLLGRFTTMDPLCEKYYHISPYAYCSNNPVNRIDPNGMADYTINKNGYLYESTGFIDRVLNFLGLGNKNDRIYMESDKSLLATYSEGTINLIKNDKAGTVLEINNNNDAEDFFQKAITNTDVEWANIRHSKNGKVSNTIVNNHQDDNVDLSAAIAKDLRSKENIILFEHSHPVPIDLKNGTNLQFDINVSGGNGMPGDIQTAKGYPGTLFRVYDLHKNQIHYYNGKGVYKTKSWKR